MEHGLLCCCCCRLMWTFIKFLLTGHGVFFAPRSIEKSSFKQWVREKQEPFLIMMCEMTENVCDSFLGFAWLLSRNFVFVWDFSPPCIKAYTGAYDRTKSGNLQQISVCDCAQELSLHSSAKAEKKMTISRYSRRKGAPRWLLELLRDFSSPQYSNEHTFWITFWIKTRWASRCKAGCT